MTKRQPKGTPVGGQFAESRKPDGGDLVEPSRFDALNSPMAGLVRRGENSYGYKGFLIEKNRGIAAWKCRVQSKNGDVRVLQYDTLKEMKFALNDVGDDYVNHETGTFYLGDHNYQYEKTGPLNDVTKYVLTNDEGGGGWRFEYDSLTRRVKAHGVRPVNPSNKWLDEGEADIRTVARLFEPNAKLINLDGKTYLPSGRDWPLSKSELSGLSSGEMMLIGGKTEDDLRAYVTQQRSDTARSESERPDMAASFVETYLYLNGIELAANIGSNAARAGTVGAMNARFGEKS